MKPCWMTNLLIGWDGSGRYAEEFDRTRGVRREFLGGNAALVDEDGGIVETG